ncbi:MAG: signal peptidase II [Actinobacteria bacterium]|nr:signal peptidase II [Actinomycetota bacterium]
MAATAAAALAADQASKALVRCFLPPGKTLDLHLLALRQVRNPGTAFGLIRGQSLPFFLGSVALLLVLVLVLWRFRGEEGRAFTAALGLIIGGALGNIIDRISLGAVVDFIDLRFWPVFNLADTAIVLGVGIALVLVIREVWREGKGATRH